MKTLFKFIITVIISVLVCAVIARFSPKFDLFIIYNAVLIIALLVARRLLAKESWKQYIGYFLYIYIIVGGCVALVNGCGPTEFEKGNRRNVPLSKEEHKLVLGNVPDRMIGYAIKKKKTGELKANIFFKSSDIDGYIGKDFSVDVFLIKYKHDNNKNDAGKYFMDTYINNFRLKVKVPILNLTVGSSDDHLIGKSHLVVTEYEYKTLSSLLRKVVLINDNEIAIFHHIYHSDPKKHLYGVAEYETSIHGRVSAVYQFTYQPDDKFSHDKFIYAKKFIEQFYF